MGCGLLVTAWLVLGNAAAREPSREDRVVAAPTSTQQPSSEPVFDEVARDPAFGVTARHFGLERQVWMYQWRREGETYSQAWSESWLDSGGYAPGHENPPQLPLRSKRWIASGIRIDGKPLDASVLRELGEWKPFRPNFSALPANLAATFQPEGDGLGSAENPLDPQIGDLRIGWRELHLPPLAGRIVLEDGRWVPGPQPRDAQDGSSEHIGGGYGVPIGIGVLVVLLALAVHRYRRHHKPD